MRVCVLGLGYIGLPTALLLADAGHEVIGVDVNKSLIEKLNMNVVSIEEPMMLNLFRRASERFHAQLEVPLADAFFICVPTPIDGELRVADLTCVRNAAAMIAPQLREGNLVIVESTVPPGTTGNLVIPILKKSGLESDQFFVAYCSERALPGNVIHEMVHNDRIVGGKDLGSATKAMLLYSSFVKGTIHLTNMNTAEFTKVMENTFRDVNIALINEMAKIAEDNNIDIWEARELANKHPRVNYVKPGPGVGGHCIAVDPWFLTNNPNNCQLIKASRDVNDNMPNIVLNMVKSIVKDVEHPIITVLGVAYKGNISDARETPAMKFIRLALNEGYVIRVHDPLVKRFDYPLEELKDATFESDCVVLLTDHEVFRAINPQQLRVRNKFLLDTRNFLDHEAWKKSGFDVKVLGRPEMIKGIPSIEETVEPKIKGTLEQRISI
jgi:UDP-N-acetyl-D-mannosaminuronic acid dehydrogenase